MAPLATLLSNESKSEAEVVVSVTTIQPTKDESTKFLVTATEPNVDEPKEVLVTTVDPLGSLPPSSRPSWGSMPQSAILSNSVYRGPSITVLPGGGLL